MKLTELFSKQKKEITSVTQISNTRFISPVFITGMIIGIILLIVMVHFGFYKTYIQHFPKFEDYKLADGGTAHFNPIMHFHGMMMMGWILMLLIQPILILKGKIKLHRQIGSLSYVLAPLVLLSLYFANRDQYFTILANKGQTAAIARLALSIPEAVFFAILYSLAILYRRNMALHMRYMCSTAFLFINPALGRFFRTWFDFKQGFPISSAIAISLVGVIMIVDSLRTKRPSPFALIFGLLLLHRIVWGLRETDFWQAIGNVIAKLF